MSNAPIYFRFFIDDYLRDAEELSLTRHGVYLRLMLWYYARAKPIPNDLLRVYQRVNARSGEEEGAVKFVLSEYFQLRDGFWHHKRIDLELADWNARSDAAKASVLAREEKRNKNKGDTSSNDERTIIERSSNQNQNQRSTKPKPTVRFSNAPGGAKKTPPETPAPEPGFLLFWKAWPANKRKVNRKGALMRWLAQNCEPFADAIVSHVEALKRTEQWQRDEGQYVPAPDTYLNQRRWEDGLPAPAAKQKSRLL